MARTDYGADGGFGPVAGRPQEVFMTAGQVSDFARAAALLISLPAAAWVIADRGSDSDWFREALTDKGIRPCRDCHVPALKINEAGA